MKNETKLIMALAVLALTFVGVAFIEDSEDSDAVTYSALTLFNGGSRTINVDPGTVTITDVHDGSYDYTASSNSFSISAGQNVSVYIYMEVDGTLMETVTITFHGNNPTPTTYTVSFSAGTGGTVSPASIANVPSGSSITVSNNTVTINGTTVTATPNSGYSFSGWTNASGTVTANRIITASFTQNTYTVSFSAGTGGTVSPTSIANVPSGSAITVSNNTVTINGTTVTATPNSGYSFNGWTNASGTVTSARTITGSFTATDSHYDAMTLFDGGSRIILVEPGTYTIDDHEDGSYYYSGNPQTFTLNAGDSQTVSVTMEIEGSSVETVQIIFTTVSYTVSFSAGTGGTVSPASIANVPSGSSITVSNNTVTINGTTVTATPNSGYSFSGWTNASGTVTANRIITASFTQNTYTVSFSAGTGGTVSPTSIANVPSGSAITVSNNTVTINGTTVTATPNSGYSFNGWTNASGTVTSARTITGSFTATDSHYDAMTLFDGGSRIILVEPGTYTIDDHEDGSYYYSGNPQTFTLNAGDSRTVFITLEIDGTLMETVRIIFTTIPIFNNNVWWDNGYVNGSASIVFNYGDATSVCTHKMSIPLLEYDGIKDDTDGIKEFSATPYTLNITLEFPRTTVTIELLENGSIVDSKRVVIGTWPQFVISIDAQRSIISFQGIGKTPTNDFNFTAFTTMFSQDLMDYSGTVSNLAFNRIYHADGAGSNHIHFQVMSTTTYLDTYGYVMIDPTLNIYDRFPENNDLRLNLYSFGLYGDTLTINGHTFNMQGSVISDMFVKHVKEPIIDTQEKQRYMGKDPQTGESIIETYYVDVIMGYREYYVISTESDPDAINLRPTLQNIYITWENINTYSEEEPRMCYLTFVDDNITIEMGSFDDGDLTISFTGMWYFTTGLWEPYQATESYYAMDWDNWFNLSGDAFILLFIGAVILGVVVASVVMDWKFELLDWAVVIGAGVVTYMLLGVF